MIYFFCILRFSPTYMLISPDNVPGTRFGLKMSLQATTNSHCPVSSQWSHRPASAQTHVKVRLTFV